MVVLGVLLAVGTAGAVTPTSMPMHGVLHDNAGAVVQDGVFPMTFTLYDAASDGVVLWQEAWPGAGATCAEAPQKCVTVENGVFGVVLGTLTPISAAVFVGVSEAWLGIAVDGEPELPRRPMGADAFAFVAGHAATADLASQADSATSADNAATADVAFALQCTACIPQTALAFELPGSGASTLPPDGLDEVSNGVLTTTFVTTHHSADTPKPNDALTGLIESNIAVPDLGFVQKFSVSFSLTHGDVSEVTVTLRSPKGAKFVLHDKTLPGQTNLVLTLTDEDAIATGSLGDIVGTEPEGGWKLTIEDLVVGQEGTLESWSMSFTAVSGDKAQVNGDLTVTGSITVGGGLGITGGELSVNGDLNLQTNQLKLPRFQLSNGPPMPCTPEVVGLFYLDLADKLVKVCVDGEFQAMNNICGDGVTSPSEACDDGNNGSGDGCNSGCGIENGFACAGNPSICTPVCGDGIKVSGETCDDGNTAAADGCSPVCVVETGFVCTGAPSVCTTVCGDGIKAGAEACDDDNTTGCDGCSATCAVDFNGQLYKGVCLAGVKYGNGEPPGAPAGCTPYQPGQGWTQADFQTLCSQYNTLLSFSANCTGVDTDADGGSCTNHTDTLAVWDNDSSVDIWVQKTSWSYSPAGGSCNRNFGGGHVALYACQ